MIFYFGKHEGIFKGYI